MGQTNEFRSFSRIAVVSGWFSRSSDEPNRHTLHIDASFREDRMGGGEGAGVQFRISLKRCEIVVKIPDPSSGAFAIDESSVDRMRPAESFSRKIVMETKREVSGSSGFKIDPNEFDAALAAGVSARRTISEQVERTEVIQILNYRHSRSLENYPCWELFANDDRMLDGAVWDAEKQPRLTIIDSRSDAIKKADRDHNNHPLALVEIRCKREDVVISDIRLADDRRFFKDIPFQQNRLRAAEAFIKAKMFEAGLHSGDLSNLFSDMRLAELVVPVTND